VHIALNGTGNEKRREKKQIIMGPACVGISFVPVLAGESRFYRF
jgi:hypothetical protein